jgi:regulator of sigma E protease
MSLLLTIVAFFVVLGPLIFVHELGHFLAARLTGVHVDEFGIGFPPRLLRLWQGAGRLWIGNLRVRIPGRFRLPDDLELGDHVGAVVAEHPGRGLELQSLELIDPDRPAAAEAEPGGAQRVSGQLTRLERGTEYTFNLTPLGGFVRLEDDPSVPGGLGAASKRVRLAVLAAGAIMNMVAAFALLTAGFMVGWPQALDDRPVAVHVTGVSPDSPAAQAGLQAGDQFVSAGDRSVKSTEELQAAIERHLAERPGTPLSIVVMRGDEELTINLVPRANPPEGQGPMGVAIAQEVETEFVQDDFVTAVGHAGGAIVQVLQFFVEVPLRVMRGLLPLAYVRPVSAVGISQMGAAVIQQTQDTGQLWHYLEFTAFVSVALAISNLLPLPALDGGRILFVLVEALRGRRIAPERETAIHFVGMAMLLLLMMVLVVQDVLFPIVNTGG